MTRFSTKSLNLGIVEDLQIAKLESIKSGHLLQSAIISFQEIEVLLRIAIDAFRKKINLSQLTIKSIEEEQSFLKLVVYFDLIKPNTSISDKLFDFNTRRNAFMHKIFYGHETILSLKRELKNFCSKSLELNRDISKLLGLYKEKGGEPD
jgi:hypothetical protein